MLPYRTDTRGPTNHDQGRQGELEQADCRDRGALHHRHGQAQAGVPLHGRPTRGPQGETFFFLYTHSSPN